MTPQNRFRLTLVALLLLGAGLGQVTVTMLGHGDKPAETVLEEQQPPAPQVAASAPDAAASDVEVEVVLPPEAAASAADAPAEPQGEPITPPEPREPATTSAQAGEPAAEAAASSQSMPFESMGLVIPVSPSGNPPAMAMPGVGGAMPNTGAGTTPQVDAPLVFTPPSLTLPKAATLPEGFASEPGRDINFAMPGTSGIPHTLPEKVTLPTAPGNPALAGAWVGTYQGTDFGQLKLTSDKTGAFSGTGYSDNLQVEFRLFGRIDSKGNLSLVRPAAGTASQGLTFTGTVVTGQAGQGKWSAGPMSPTWRGSWEIRRIGDADSQP